MKRLIMGVLALGLAFPAAAQQPAPESAPAPGVGAGVKPPQPPRVKAGKISAAPAPVAGVRAPAQLSMPLARLNAPRLPLDGIRTEVYLNQDDQDQADDPVKMKTFSKSFALDRNDKVTLGNVYGSITVKTWDKAEIKVDADIKAYANTEAEAQRLLDGVSISASKDGDQVTVKTHMAERGGNWGRGSMNGKRWRRELKAHLTVYMPKTNALNVSQEYGNINIDDFAGPTSLKVQYGNITGGDLTSTNNYISAQYAGVKFNDINQAKIRHEYGSGLTIGNINVIDLDSQYARVTISAIRTSGNIRQEYGSGITIGSVNNLTLNAHYTHARLSNVTGNVSARLEYGSFAASNVDSGVRNLNVSGNYTNVSLGFSPGYNADFTVNTEYASFKYGSGVTARKQGEDRGFNPSKNYTGQIGKGGSGNVVVRADYGSVTFR